MTRERSTQSQGSKAAYRGGGDELPSDVQKLLDRAPQFGALAKAAEGLRTELSHSQREVLDDFAQRLAEETDRVAEPDDA